MVGQGLRINFGILTKMNPFPKRPRNEFKLGSKTRSKLFGNPLGGHLGNLYWPPLGCKNIILHIFCSCASSVNIVPDLCEIVYLLLAVSSFAVQKQLFGSWARFYNLGLDAQNPPFGRAQDIEKATVFGQIWLHDTICGFIATNSYYFVLLLESTENADV